MSLLACIILSIGLVYRLWKSQSSCLTSGSLRNNPISHIDQLAVPANKWPPQQQSFRPPPFPSDNFQRSRLSAVVLFRLFSKDALHFNRNDLDQWMTYMSYAGVDHFYLYDNCLAESECQRDVAKRPDVTYVQWSHTDYMTSQTPAYNHHLQAHYPQANFEILIDIDEFPFKPNDTDQGFLQRHVLHRNKSQLLLRTIFFGGPATTTANNSSETSNSKELWRVNRYIHRRSVAEKESRTKPIYQPSQVDSRGSTNLHEMKMRYTQELSLANDLPIDDPQVSPYDKYMGFDMAEDPNVLRLNHYWCERMAPQPTDVFDDSMHDLTHKIKQWSENKKGWTILQHIIKKHWFQYFWEKEELYGMYSKTSGI